LKPGQLLPDLITETNGYVAWANDSKTLYYTVQNEVTLRSEKVFRHSLGDDPEDRDLVYFEEDDTYRVGVFTTKSREYLMIVSSSTLSTEYRYADAGDPSASFLVFHPRERDMRYSVDHHGDNFYIVTNWDARNFRLMETPVGHTEKRYWNELVPHRDDVLLTGIEIFSDYLVLSERKNGLTQLYIHNWKSNEGSWLEFPKRCIRRVFL
jgi:oligopeptidase B